MFKSSRIPGPLCGLFTALLFICSASAARAEVFIGQFIEVELLSEFDAIQRGEPLSMAFRLQPDPHWHVYWKYAGDSGAAPKLKWSLHGTPLQAEIFWPRPQRIPFGPLVNYGYENEVFLLAKLAVPTELVQASDATIELDAEWLVCMEECIPGNVQMVLNLPVRDTPAKPLEKWAAQFKRWRSLVPRQSAPAGITELAITARADGPSYFLEFTPPPSRSPGEYQINFFPDSPGQIENAAPQVLSFVDGKLSLQLTKAGLTAADVTALSGVLVSNLDLFELPDSKYFDFRAEIQGSNRIEEVRRESKQASQVGSRLGSWEAILLAFIGGLLLNLMPCVLPVISIKVLGFVQLAADNPMRVRLHGLAFSFGVILSFLALAAFIGVLQSGGHALGWGFQLQSPAFVAVLALLVLTIAFNFMGVFEVGAGLQRIGGRIHEGKGLSGSFLSGVLATVLATPCTAPFMGSALAYALTVGVMEGGLIFFALGCGMALPYLLLSWRPRLLKYMPKPGKWMSMLKQLLAFPLFATFIWLAWILGLQAGLAAVIVLMISALAVFFSTWLIGRLGSPIHSKSIRLSAKLAAAVIYVAFVSYAAMVANASHYSSSSSSSGIYKDQWGQNWEIFTKEKFAAAASSREPVYLDFTAAWCVTCQVNKQVVFSSELVRNSLRNKNVKLIRADWTNEDPEITAALRSFERRGVPLNVFYPGNGRQPVILPTILTPSIVLQHLEYTSSGP